MGCQPNAPKRNVFGGHEPSAHKRRFVADSPNSGLVYPHKVGLASHIRNGNYDETPIPLRGRPDDKN